jgi:hypothetical protein
VLPTKVLYITGMGRSGSTILGNTLGQIEGFCHVGELRHFWGSGLLGGGFCGCGLLVTECAFWSSVTELAVAGDRYKHAARMVELQRTTVRARRSAHAAVHLLGARSADYDEYASTLGAYYGAIAATAGAKVVVDGSKHPNDLLLISRIPGVELYVLHLVRDPRAVAFSWGTMKEKPGGGSMRRSPPFKVSIRWSIRSLLDGAHRFRGRGNYLPVRYEDFAGAPVETLEKITRWLGHDVPKVPVDTETRRVILYPTHTASGNPGRHQYGEVAIVPDDRWKQSMPTKDFLLATVPAFPLLWFHGYRIRVPQFRRGRLKAATGAQRRESARVR